MIYKLARIILIISSAFIMVYGIMIIFKPAFITHNLEIYANVDLTNFENKPMVDWISMAMQLLGCFNIIAGLVGIIVVYKSFVLKEKWLLIIIFFTTIFGYAAPVTFDLKTGVIRWMEIIELISFSLTVIAFIILLWEFNKSSDISLGQGLSSS